ncbi:MAG TPA: fumarylacetoacetate hydrolase family protein [Myxococcota bacterium]|nr:fumarylacetoacetate hydrolase family protein [Myxococcota bacterium]
MAVRLVNARGRSGLCVDKRIVDVERASGGRFGADPMQALARWEEFRGWAEGVRAGAGDAPLDEPALGPVAPRPAKVFGIGLNYRTHAAESNMEIPKQPLVFTKFPNCLAGPRADVALTSERVDYEVELVAVIGRRGRRIDEARALEHVAGYCVGQDISDRALQFADKPPQFSMGKSADSFGPIGPALVSLDAFADPDDLPLWCEIGGERLQEDRTRNLIFPVGELVSYLSRFCTLEPGDLIFTGTPAGVGSTRQPRRYLAPGDVIESAIEGIGELRNRCVPGL